MELWMSIMAACPGCKEGFDAATARGFSYSNLLMLSLSYGMAGAIVFAVVRTMRRESAAASGGTAS